MVSHELLNEIIVREAVGIPPGEGKVGGGSKAAWVEDETSR